MNLGLFYVETLVFGQAEDEGVLVAQVIMRILGYLNRCETADDLVQSCAD